MIQTLLTTTLLTVAPVIGLHTSLGSSPTIQPGLPTQDRANDSLVIGIEEPTGEEVLMTNFAPQGTAPRELVGAAQAFVGRDVYLEDPGNGSFRAIENMRSFQDHVIVLETEKRMAGVLEALVELDRLTTPGRGASSLDGPFIVTQLAPRNVTVDTLYSALQPFERLINENLPDGSRFQTKNMTLVRETGQIVIRETEERTVEMLDLAASIDLPVAQLDLVCMVIRGLDPDDEGDRSKDLPSELTASLTELLPHEGYERAGVGALRIAAVPGARTSLVLTGPTLQEHSLDLSLSTFDSSSGNLDISECRFGVRGHQPLFETATRIRMGEYVVLGVSGEDPLFVVLRIQ